MAHQFLRVALTGGLASGKSTVLRTVAVAGVATIDNDRLARDALKPGSPIIPAIRQLLGEQIEAVDGSLDRRRIASAVFADPDKRRALEALVHPLVRAAEERLVESFRAAGEDLVVIDVPVLFEVGRQTAYDLVVVVACEEPTQLQRAIARGMNETDARARIAAQLPIAGKRARADIVIDTNGTVDDTQRQARELVVELRRRCAVDTGSRLPTAD